MQAALKPITNEEKEWAEQLPKKRSEEYQHSRGYVREALSEIWNLPPLKIPLNALPGKPPELAKGWGHVSFSHCCDGLLIGWSPTRIGVDIERVDRTFKADQITQRYFSQSEQEELANLHPNEMRKAVLKQWTAKEAAIKWQQGSLAKDISQWTFSKTAEIAVHQALGYQVGLYILTYNSWYIAVAYDNIIHKCHPILCQDWM